VYTLEARFVGTPRKAILGFGLLKRRNFTYVVLKLRPEIHMFKKSIKLAQNIHQSHILLSLSQNYATTKKNYLGICSLYEWQRGEDDPKEDVPKHC
jgi:hypothetical protein